MGNAYKEGRAPAEGSDGELGQRIVEAREALGLSTAQLARRLAVRTATLSGWEAGRAEPRANKLMMIAGVLNVSLSWLLTGRGESPAEHSSEAEIAHLKASLATLKVQAEGIVEQIDQIVGRLENFERYRD